MSPKVSASSRNPANQYTIVANNIGSIIRPGICAADALDLFSEIVSPLNVKSMEK